MLKLNVALPSTTIKLEIALTSVSTVLMVNESPRIMIINDKNSVWSFNNNEKKPKSGTTFEDPWGNSLVYEPADPEFKQPEDPDYRLYSKGPNGLEGDEVDIGDKEQEEEVDSLEELGEAGGGLTTGNE